MPVMTEKSERSQKRDCQKGKKALFPAGIWGRVIAFREPIFLPCFPRHSIKYEWSKFTTAQKQSGRSILETTY